MAWAQQAAAQGHRQSPTDSAPPPARAWPVRSKTSDAATPALCCKHWPAPSTTNPPPKFVLRESLTPPGVRLSTATLHQLATDIAAGRPVELT